MRRSEPARRLASIVPEAWHDLLLAGGRTVLDAPGYYGDGYYAVFFQDPDGMKLEIGHHGPAWSRGDQRPR
jgi:hypothetical protein